MTSGAQCPLITLHAVTLRKGQAHLLPGTSWQICRGQQWVILGPHGSGKSTLARAVRGDVAHVRGTITRHVPEAGPEGIGYLSFEMQEALFQRAERLAESLSFGRRKATTMIYVTHHPEEIIPCIRHVLELDKPPVPVTSPDAADRVQLACPAAR